MVGLTGTAGAPPEPEVFFSRTGEPNSNKPSPAPALDPLKGAPPLTDRNDTLEEILTDRRRLNDAPTRCTLSNPDTSCDKARTRGARSHLIQ